jgi:alginate O-acetyltransferase complex protein AlgI
MLFNSYEFIFLFLPIALIGFHSLRRNWHLASLWLIICSLFFYGWWNPVYLWLIAASIFTNFLFGWSLQRRPSKWILIGGIAFNLIALGHFKYTDFLLSTIGGITSIRTSQFDIALPLAISFFTFQQIAYLVDSYRGLIASHKAKDYVLFVTFFPQLIAGPIVHQAEMLPQFKKSQNHADWVLIGEGLAFFTVGLFKKVIIADNIAPYSTNVFTAAAIDAVSGGAAVSFFDAWSGVLAYTFQIYFDFSGYCDMAIGSARLFGIRLPLNFASPYKALSISDFWRRWHMTLSRFLRDYLYFPLGGNHHGKAAQFRTLMIVMLLGGLWHGADWTFVIWGGLHGLYLLINHGWRHFKSGTSGSSIWSSAGAWLLTFFAVVVAWVFFRSESLGTALVMLKAMAGFNGFVLGLNHQSYLGPLAPWAQTLGIEFSTQAQFSAWSVLWIAGCLTISLAMPNSQEWITGKGNSLWVKTENKLITALAWRSTVFWGGVLGLMAAVSVGYLSKASEFLYFNF